jgi:hypothetical protein
MKRKHSEPTLADRPRIRLAFGFVGVLAVGLGLLALLSGHLHYANWWGGPVFAPFAILVGLILLGIAIYGRTIKAKRLKP